MNGVDKATIHNHAERETTCFKTRHGNTHIIAVHPVPPRMDTTSVTLGAMMASDDVRIRDVPATRARITNVLSTPKRVMIASRAGNMFAAMQAPTLKIKHPRITTKIGSSSGYMSTMFPSVARPKESYAEVATAT
jgi:hypothetical protein